MLAKNFEMRAAAIAEARSQVRKMKILLASYSELPRDWLIAKRLAALQWPAATPDCLR